MLKMRVLVFIGRSTMLTTLVSIISCLNFRNQYLFNEQIKQGRADNNSLEPLEWIAICSAFYLICPVPYLALVTCCLVVPFAVSKFYMNMMDTLKNYGNDFSSESKSYFIKYYQFLHRRNQHFGFKDGDLDNFIALTSDYTPIDSESKAIGLKDIVAKLRGSKHSAKDHQEALQALRTLPLKEIIALKKHIAKKDKNLASRIIKRLSIDFISEFLRNNLHNLLLGALVLAAGVEVGLFFATARAISLLSLCSIAIGSYSLTCKIRVAGFKVIPAFVENCVHNVYESLAPLMLFASQANLLTRMATISRSFIHLAEISSSVPYYTTKLLIKPLLFAGYNITKLCKKAVRYFTNNKAQAPELLTKFGRFLKHALDVVNIGLSLYKYDLSGPKQETSPQALNLPQSRYFATFFELVDFHRNYRDMAQPKFSFYSLSSNSQTVSNVTALFEKMVEPENKEIFVSKLRERIRADNYQDKLGRLNDTDLLDDLKKSLLIATTTPEKLSGAGRVQSDYQIEYLAKNIAHILLSNITSNDQQYKDGKISAQEHRRALDRVMNQFVNITTKAKFCSAGVYNSLYEVLQSSIVSESVDSDIYNTFLKRRLVSRETAFTIGFGQALDNTKNIERLSRLTQGDHSDDTQFAEHGQNLNEAILTDVDYQSKLKESLPQIALMKSSRSSSGIANSIIMEILLDKSLSKYIGKEIHSIFKSLSPIDQAKNQILSSQMGYESANEVIFTFSECYRESLQPELREITSQSRTELLSIWARIKNGHYGTQLFYVQNGLLLNSDEYIAHCNEKRRVLLSSLEDCENSKEFKPSDAFNPYKLSGEVQQTVKRYHYRKGINQIDKKLKVIEKNSQKYREFESVFNKTTQETLSDLFAHTANDNATDRAYAVKEAITYILSSIKEKAIAVPDQFYIELESLLKDRAKTIFAQELKGVHSKTMEESEKRYNAELLEENRLEIQEYEQAYQYRDSLPESERQFLDQQEPLGSRPEELTLEKIENDPRIKFKREQDLKGVFKDLTDYDMTVFTGLLYEDQFYPKLELPPTLESSLSSLKQDLDRVTQCITKCPNFMNHLLGLDHDTVLNENKEVSVNPAFVKAILLEKKVLQLSSKHTDMTATKLQRLAPSEKSEQVRKLMMAFG